ncbi:hypothetical protein ACFL6U_08260 [Planctomycetota bacterium]
MARAWLRFNHSLCIVLMCLFVSSIPVVYAGQSQVTVIAAANLEAPAFHGLRKLEQALQGHGHTVAFAQSMESATGDFLIVAGKATAAGPAAQMLRVLNVPLPTTAQALVMQRTTVAGKPAIILCGADAVGLMYAALDTAERVSWSQAGEDLFAHIRNVSEKPYVSELAVSIYTESQDIKLNPTTGLYQATIPGEFITPEWDLMYFAEAVDTQGNGCMIPDLEKEMPYVIVELDR